MINKNKLNDMASDIFEALPDKIKTMSADAKKVMQQSLAASLQKLDLVTREEFDVQTKILHRTREKLKQLEQQVADIEHKANGS